jgi:superoxide dismutase
MELHHGKHHQTYITNLNAALKTQAEAVHASDITSQLSLQQGIKFNGGGHINHSLFWQNLAPASSPEAKITSAPELSKQIKATWGDEEKFKEAFNAALLSIQGSGWGWLIKVETGKEQRLAIVTTKDQDPVVGKGEVPVFGVDMWEHAYYLQASCHFPDQNLYADSTAVSEWQSCVRAEHLERHQLEDSGRAIPWNTGGCFQDTQSIHLDRGIVAVVLKDTHKLTGTRHDMGRPHCRAWSTLVSVIVLRYVLVANQVLC